MALFPRCNNPVPVAGRHGLTLVGCHSCIQCRVAAQEHLCKILEVEASGQSVINLLKTQTLLTVKEHKNPPGIS